MVNRLEIADAVASCQEAGRRDAVCAVGRETCKRCRLRVEYLRATPGVGEFAGAGSEI